MATISILLVILMMTYTDAEEKLCLACKNSPFPSHCNRVAKCGAYDRCYMEMYVNTLGEIRYDFGCKDEQFCNQVSHTKRQAGHIHVCTHCCNSTMCNFAGCGNTNLPDRNQRGPMCFACDTHNKVDDCAEFKQCNRGEVCVLEQDIIPVTGAETYSSGCMQASTCENIYQRMNNIFPMVGKRSYDHLIQFGKDCIIECCDVDFCNRGCGGINTQKNMTIVYQTVSPNIQPRTKTATPSTQVTTLAPVVFSSKTFLQTTTRKMQQTSSTTGAPFTYTQTQTTHDPRMASTRYQTPQNFGCVNDLPDTYCHNNDVLASLCHLNNLAFKCRKSCHLCCKLFD